MKRIAIILLASIALSGCASMNMDKYLGNRIVCTVSGDKAYVNSLWGWLGIASEIVEQDAKKICTVTNTANNEER